MVRSRSALKSVRPFAVQNGSPQDADAVARGVADLVDRLACGWCLVWAKHDSLVAAAKAAAPELDVRFSHNRAESSAKGNSERLVPSLLLVL